MPVDESLISADIRGRALVVTLHTQGLDSSNVDSVKQALDEATRRTPTGPVALDLGEVEHLGSPGLGVLIHLHTMLQQVNRRFGVCGARREAAEAIRITRLDRLFGVYASVDEFLLRTRDGR
jgi:anti-anti-sigma factor